LGPDARHSDQRRRERVTMGQKIEVACKTVTVDEQSIGLHRLLLLWENYQV